jgi:hypothetical protein
MVTRRGSRADLLIVEQRHAAHRGLVRQGLGAAAGVNQCRERAEAHGQVVQSPRKYELVLDACTRDQPSANEVCPRASTSLFRGSLTWKLLHREKQTRSRSSSPPMVPGCTSHMLSSKSMMSPGLLPSSRASSCSSTAWCFSYIYIHVNILNNLVNGGAHAQSRRLPLG